MSGVRPQDAEVAIERGAVWLVVVCLFADLFLCCCATKSDAEKVTDATPPLMAPLKRHGALGRGEQVRVKPAQCTGSLVAFPTQNPFVGTKQSHFERFVCTGRRTNDSA